MSLVITAYNLSIVVLFVRIDKEGTSNKQLWQAEYQKVDSERQGYQVCTRKCSWYQQLRKREDNRTGQREKAGHDASQ